MTLVLEMGLGYDPHNRDKNKALDCPPGQDPKDTFLMIPHTWVARYQEIKLDSG